MARGQAKEMPGCASPAPGDNMSTSHSATNAQIATSSLQRKGVGDEVGLLRADALLVFDRR